MQMAESTVVAQLKGGCSAGSGPDLTGYPHLVYAPAQWGDGVRLASSGCPVYRVAKYANDFPIGTVAEMFCITIEEAAEAYRYAKANGLI